PKGETMRTVVCATMLAALAGCAAQPTYMWVRADTTQGQFNQDRAQCIYEAEAAVATYGSSAPTPRTMGGAIGQGIGIGIGKAMEGNRLAVLCMQAHGYAQRPVDLDAVAAANAGVAPVPTAAVVPSLPAPETRSSAPTVRQFVLTGE